MHIDTYRRRFVVPDGEADYGILVHEFEKNSRETIRIHVQEYMGTVFLDLREFYKDRSTGELKPSRSGLTVKPELFAELLHGVVSAADALGVDMPEGLLD
jgi:hypothetical protein